MEAGTREFGMCTNSNSPDKAFSDYGTMLEIRDIQYFPDGRSVVDTMGGRRFKVGFQHRYHPLLGRLFWLERSMLQKLKLTLQVISRGTKDGYSTASVEFLKDNVPEDPELEALQVVWN